MGQITTALAAGLAFGLAVGFSLHAWAASSEQVCAALVPGAPELIAECVRLLDTAGLQEVEFAEVQQVCDALASQSVQPVGPSQCSQVLTTAPGLL